MGNIVKKILRESDFDWTEEIEPVEFGKFDESEVSFEDVDAKVYLGEEDKVTYKLKLEEFIEYSYVDENGEWVLETLVLMNGTPEYDSENGDLNDEEIDYLDNYLSNTQLDRLKEIFTHYGISINDNVYKEGRFTEIGDEIEGIYTGVWGFEDFASESLSQLSATIEYNRWISLNENYEDILMDNDVKISSGFNGDIIVEMNFPYEGSNNLSECLANIGLSDYSWGDMFYEEWDTDGAHEHIQHTFDKLLKNIENQINEENNS